jgi:hypothetical protein
MLGLKLDYTVKFIVFGIEVVHMVKNSEIFYGTSLFKIRKIQVIIWHYCINLIPLKICMIFQEHSMFVSGLLIF